MSHRLAMLLCGFTMLLLQGCLPAVKSNEAVIDADQAMVASCAYVKDVAGTSFWGGPGGSRRGFSKARNEAREEAKEAGATHIVWEGVGTAYVSSANGKAYRCPR
jgi:hypothetical protein